MALPSYFNSSLAKGLAILETIASNNASLTLTEIARSLDMDKSTTKRFLSTLIDLGYVSVGQAGKTYAVSLQTLKLGYSALSGLAWRDIAKVHLEKLYEEVQETVSASVLDNEHTLYIIRFAKPGFYVDGAVGFRRPAYFSSMGKMLLALVEPVSERKRLVESIKMTPVTLFTHRTHEALLADLEVTRRRGYAIANQEFSEFVRSIGVPILFHSKPVAAFNIAVPVETYSVEQMVEILLPKMLACSRRISKALDRIEYSL